jgi:hypothetical protein
MKYLAIIIFCYILPCCLYSQNKNTILYKNNTTNCKDQISGSHNSNLNTNYFSNKNLLVEVKQADSSMIIKVTPPELLKHKNLAVKQADASMIIKETPPELLKHKNLVVKQADASMIIKETPPELLKQKFK